MVLISGVVVCWGVQALRAHRQSITNAVGAFLAVGLARWSPQWPGTWLGSLPRALRRGGMVIPFLGMGLVLGSGTVPALAVPLVPVSASRLSLTQMHLTIGMHTLPTGGVLVAFTFWAGGTPVAFAAHDRLTCNGRRLIFSDDVVDAYSQTFTEPLLLCLIHHGAEQTSFLLPLPTMFHMIAPLPGAVVPRSAALTLHYRAEHAGNVIAMAGNAISTPTVAGNAQPDTGTYHLGMVAPLLPGNGTVTVVRQQRGVITGTSFAAVQFIATASTTITVRWA